MHEMSVGDRQEMEKYHSMLPVLHANMFLYTMHDGKRRNCFIQENYTISFNYSVSSLSAFGNLSL